MTDINLTGFDLESKPVKEKVYELFEFKPKATEFVPKQAIFDRANVKLGAMVDEAKIKAKIEKAEATFDAKLITDEEDFYQDLKDEEEKFWKGLIDKAALNAMTAEIIAIGFITPDGDKDMYTGAEKDLIKQMWGRYNAIKQANVDRTMLVGWNIFGFDLPMLVTRSRILNIPVPPFKVNTRFYDPLFHDLQPNWCDYVYGKYCKLSTAAKACGIAADRSNDCGGEFFWKVLEEEGAEKALPHLSNDLDETMGMAQRLLNNK